MGAFDRGVTCVAFSKSVRRSSVWRFWDANLLINNCIELVLVLSEWRHVPLCCGRCQRSHPVRLELAEGEAAGWGQGTQKIHCPNLCWSYNPPFLLTLPVSAVLQWFRAGCCVSSHGWQPDRHLWKISHQLLDHRFQHPRKEAGPVWGNHSCSRPRCRGLFRCIKVDFCSCVSLQKHEKPKYVLCVAFAENGDAITGDSSGNIYIWAKGWP